MFEKYTEITIGSRVRINCGIFKDVKGTVTGDNTQHSSPLHFMHYVAFDAPFFHNNNIIGDYSYCYPHELELL